MSNRTVAKSSGWGEPPREVDPIADLVRILDEARIRTHAMMLALLERRVTSARFGMSEGYMRTAAPENPELLPMCFPIDSSGKQYSV